MICRMNKHQREALKNLMKAYAIEATSPFYNADQPTPRIINAEKVFDEAFANEDKKEDTHNHVG